MDEYILLYSEESLRLTSLPTSAQATCYTSLTSQHFSLNRADKHQDCPASSGVNTSLTLWFKSDIKINHHQSNFAIIFSCGSDLNVQQRRHHLTVQAEFIELFHQLSRFTWDDGERLRDYVEWLKSSFQNACSQLNGEKTAWSVWTYSLEMATLTEEMII